jgi:hypothetical protein
VLRQNFDAADAVHTASEDAAVRTYRAHHEWKHHALFLTPFKHFVDTVCEIVFCFNEIEISHWIPRRLMASASFYDEGKNGSDQRQEA